MENCVFYTLTFREAMSIISTNGISLTQFDKPAWYKNNSLSKAITGIISRAYDATTAAALDDFYTRCPIFEYSNNSWTLTAYGKKLLDYLMNEYGNSYAVNCENDEATTLFKNSVSLLDSIFNIIYVTYDKYKVLLDAYANESNFLRGVISTQNTSGSSSATSAYNNAGFNKDKDTPQSAVTLASLGDDYNSNVSVNESTGGNSNQAESQGAITTEDERDSVIARLAEVEEKYSNLIDKWAREFKPLFWE